MIIWIQAGGGGGGRSYYSTSGSIRPVVLFHPRNKTSALFSLVVSFIKIKVVGCDFYTTWNVSENIHSRERVCYC